MDVESHDTKRPTFTERGDSWHPAAHPFKEEVVFESGPIGDEELYTMDFEGKNLKRIADDGSRKRLPAVSPNGEKIVYMSYVGGGADRHREIFIMDYDGSNILQLTDDPTKKDSHPSFSPDGKLIIYESGIRDNDDIVIMNLDGSEKQKLTSSRDKDWDPVFLFQTTEKSNQ